MPKGPGESSIFMISLPHFGLLAAFDVALCSLAGEGDAVNFFVYTSNELYFCVLGLADFV